MTRGRERFVEIAPDRICANPTSMWIDNMIGTWLGSGRLLVRGGRRFWMCAALAAMLTGCGSGVKKPDWPEGVDASGAVQMDGKPLEMALVNFIPEGETTGPGATGMTDSVGDYSLMHRDANGKMAKGVIPGKYKVMISKFVSPDGSVWTPDQKAVAGPMTTGARETVPMKYSTPATTLRAVVGPSGGTYNFEVKSK